VKKSTSNQAIQQPICKNKAVCENSHYIYKKGFIDHRSARGKNEDTKIAREDRDKRPLHSVGRAGRTRRGMCYRIYTKNVYDKEMLEEYEPEIVNTN
jgi:hypothetical protein